MAKTINDNLTIVREELKKLEDKNFNFYFFIMDSKNNPSGLLAYMYETAYILKEEGYNVTMLYQLDKEEAEEGFCGVGEWLGQKYADLPHKDIATENVDIAPSDFLFIPEVYAGIMGQTKKFPCKRIAVVYNANYLPEFVPVGSDLPTLHIYDAITTSAVQAEKIKSWFPIVKTSIVRPSVKSMFRPSDEPKKLVVNIVTKDSTFAKKIIQPFFWKYPAYKWITFREIRNHAQENVAEAFRESVLTIWADEATPYGMTILEAAKCGSLVMAKAPQEPTDWMIEDGNLTEDILWFDDTNVAVDMLASILHTWMYDNIPAELYAGVKRLGERACTYEQQKADVENVYINGYIEARKKEFKTLITALERNNDKK